MGWKKLIVVVLIAPLGWMSCDLPMDPGPMPTETIATEFVPGHNILGVLRLDDTPGSSFVRVERAYRAEESSEEFSALISAAQVRVESGGTALSFILLSDSLRGDIYVNAEFIPVEGQEYSLSVTSPDLPDLTATTRIPKKPDIDQSTVNISSRSVAFTIIPSADIDLYEVHLIAVQGFTNERFVNRGENILVQLDWIQASGEIPEVKVFGYESNLADYMLSAITIKPQSYHEMVTTVEGGYGCFGAVSVTRIDFQ